ADTYTAILTSERSARTYVETVRSTDVLQQVISDLKLPLSLSQLRGKISARQVLDTQLVRVSVEDTSAARAKQIANRIADVFTRQNAERVQARFQPQKEDMDARIAALEKSMAETQATIASLTDPGRGRTSAELPEYARTELNKAQTKLAADNTKYVNLLQKAEEFRFAAARYSNNIYVVAPAEAPSSPVRPKTMFNVFIGALAGLVVGLLGSVVLEYMDDTVKSSDEILNALGITALGTLPRNRLGTGPELVTSFDDRSPATESYRALRTNLQFAAIDKSLSSILVTSPLPREGKTTTVANLGIVMAQTGLNTILVDTDLRLPTLNRFFNLPNHQGVTSVLLSTDTDVETALQHTDVPNLRVLTSGPIPPNPPELLASERMKGLIRQLKAIADIVIFDTPPVLAVTDAAVLAQEVDGAMLVFAAGETRRGASVQARDALKAVGANIIGAALNKSSSSGYAYYYYYSYYYTSPTGERRRRRSGNGRLGGLRRW
ncbi:MAG: polysaccharide biosynthesis tyrosine autokinase, partial [Chloroflexi bacterium]|nr:polysaccharide biosynthesis tyrosine autokinase [Chloroflexota bacterium]